MVKTRSALLVDSRGVFPATTRRLLVFASFSADSVAVLSISRDDSAETPANSCPRLVTASLVLRFSPERGASTTIVPSASSEGTRGAMCAQREEAHRGLGFLNTLLSLFGWSAGLEWLGRYGLITVSPSSKPDTVPP